MVILLVTAGRRAGGPGGSSDGPAASGPVDLGGDGG